MSTTTANNCSPIEFLELGSQVGHAHSLLGAGNASTEKSTQKDQPTSTSSEANIRPEPNFPDGGARAWLIVLGAACISCATYGFTNTWAIYQALYEEERLRGYTPSTIAWIGSTQYALLFLPGLLTGRLFDMGVYHVPMLFWSCVLVASCFLVAECHSYWQLFLVQGVLVGLSCGCLAGPCMAVITHWFEKRRSLAFGVTALGSSLGGTCFPILVRNLKRSIGFVWTMRVVGFIIFCLLIVSNLVLRRRLPPSSKGRIVSLGAFKDQAYALYVASSFFCFLGIYAALTYMDVAAITHGISPDFSFYLVSIANASSAVGRLTAGLVGDRLGAINTMVPFTLLAAVMTIAWPFATLLGPTIAVAIIYGFASGTYIALMGVPIAQLGDYTDIGQRSGMKDMIMAIGALTGPPTCGAIASAAGSYVPLGAFAGSMVFIAVALMLCAKKIATGHWIHYVF